MAVIKIEAVTDLLCPWCYIGKKNLDRAIDQYRVLDPTAEFEVAWKPFYLAPAMKNSGYDKRSIYVRRFTANGSSFETNLLRVAETCARSGIALDLAGKTGNTRQAHKLLALALARGPDVQDRLLDALFRGHFETGADVTDRGFLLAAAAEAGLLCPTDAEDDFPGGGSLDGRDVEAVLDSERAGEVVDAEVLRAKKAGVTGVPTFTVQGRWRVGGSQEPDVFLRVFERITDED
ncbi:dsbA oxidoreductase [Colletotrichum musicola]|uniref:DsbA oxidoreductase n=1 Tax=Colletotrichum musicola TaxID=2175873 RepID=A0A8H6NBQ7_9PEZI|nr:dsbA oxidoreductase [Colletotrichum musicola]